MIDNPNALRIRDVETLFRPFRHRKLSLPTSLVMATMTRGLAPGGIPTEEMAHYYERRAGHELGLIITEGATINEAAASADTGVPEFHSARALRAWKDIVRRVHHTGCRIAVQLRHVGMARPLPGEADMPNPDQPPIGPSGIRLADLSPAGEPMSRAKIAEVVAAFAEAATNARRLGFDAVELHGAHGHLIDQFLWSATNGREDEYGGDIVGRTRFACEVIHAVRKAVGSHFPIIFRLSQWKAGHDDARLAHTPDELAALLQPLADAGVDIFHCSMQHFAAPEFAGSPLNLAGWVKRLTGRPTIAVGSVGLGADSRRSGLDRLVQMMGADEFDLVALGRALLADPAWGSKVRRGQEEDIVPFTLRSLGRLY